MFLTWAWVNSLNFIKKNVFRSIWILRWAYVLCKDLANGRAHIDDEEEETKCLLILASESHSLCLFSMLIYSTVVFRHVYWCYQSDQSLHFKMLDPHIRHTDLLRPYEYGIVSIKSIEYASATTLIIYDYSIQISVAKKMPEIIIQLASLLWNRLTVMNWQIWIHNSRRHCGGTYLLVIYVSRKRKIHILKNCVWKFSNAFNWNNGFQLAVCCCVCCWCYTKYAVCCMPIDV